MFPLEIWIIILSFVCNNKNKFQILNIRLINKYLLSVVNTFCTLELNEMYKKDFVLINRNLKLKNPFVSFLKTESSDELSISMDALFLKNFKLIISENFKYFIFDPFIKKDKIISIEKKGQILKQKDDIFYRSAQKLKFKNFHFTTHVFKKSKFKFINCIFENGLSINKDRCILKNCTIFGRLYFYFCCVSEFKSTNILQIQNLTKGNKFYNHKNEEVDLFNDGSFEKELITTKNNVRSCSKLQGLIFQLTINDFYFELFISDPKEHNN